MQQYDRTILEVKYTKNNSEPGGKRVMGNIKFLYFQAQNIILY